MFKKKQEPEYEIIGNVVQQAAIRNRKLTREKLSLYRKLGKDFSKENIDEMMEIIDLQIFLFNELKKLVKESDYKEWLTGELSQFKRHVVLGEEILDSLLATFKRQKSIKSFEELSALFRIEVDLYKNYEKTCTEFTDFLMGKIHKDFKVTTIASVAGLVFVPFMIFMPEYSQEFKNAMTFVMCGSAVRLIKRMKKFGTAIVRIDVSSRTIG